MQVNQLHSSRRTFRARKSCLYLDHENIYACHFTCILCPDRSCTILVSHTATKILLLKILHSKCAVEYEIWIWNTPNVFGFNFFASSDSQGFFSWNKITNLQSCLVHHHSKSFLHSISWYIQGLWVSTWAACALGEENTHPNFVKLWTHHVVTLGHHCLYISLFRPLYFHTKVLGAGPSSSIFLKWTRQEGVFLSYGIKLPLSLPLWSKTTPS